MTCWNRSCNAHFLIIVCKCWWKRNKRMVPPHFTLQCFLTALVSIAVFSLTTVVFPCSNILASASAQVLPVCGSLQHCPQFALDVFLLVFNDCKVINEPSMIAFRLRIIHEYFQCWFWIRLALGVSRMSQSILWFRSFVARAQLGTNERFKNGNRYVSSCSGFCHGWWRAGCETGAIVVEIVGVSLNVISHSFFGMSSRFQPPIYMHPQAKTSWNAALHMWRLELKREYEWCQVKGFWSLIQIVKRLININ